MTQKTCGELFEGIDCTIIGNADELVSGIAYRSDCVKPGDAFCCIVGLKSDGHSYAQDAIDRGARVLIVERKIYLADATDITEVVVKDSRKAMARMASRFYGEPSKEFSLVGVTGTNGKTTTTYLVDHIAQHLGNRTGLIGTVGIEIGGEHRPSSHTTPESPDLQELLAQMRDEDCGVVSMEVSSHALDLDRTWATSFAVTAFTNLTQDHLDYHKTFESYFAAKARLFSKDYPAKRVINIESAWGKELLKRCSANEDAIITTGFDASAQIHPVAVECGSAETTVTLSVRGSNITFTYPLVGRFNVENIMTAFGVAMHLGYLPSTIAEALRDAPAVQVVCSAFAPSMTAAFRCTLTMPTPLMLWKTPSPLFPPWSTTGIKPWLCSAVVATAIRASAPLWAKLRWLPIMRWLPPTTPAPRTGTKYHR